MCLPCLSHILKHPVLEPKCPLHSTRITSVNGEPFHWEPSFQLPDNIINRVALCALLLIGSSTYLFCYYQGTAVSLLLQDEKDPGLAGKVLLSPIYTSLVANIMQEMARIYLGRLPILSRIDIFGWMPTGFGAAACLSNHVIQPLIAQAAPESVAPIATTAAYTAIAFTAFKALKSCYQTIKTTFNPDRKKFLQRCTGILSGVAIGFGFQILRQNLWSPEPS